MKAYKKILKYLIHKLSKFLRYTQLKWLFKYYFYFLQYIFISFGAVFNRQNLYIKRCTAIQNNYSNNVLKHTSMERVIGLSQIITV